MLQFPDIGSKQCQFFRACGTLTAPDKFKNALKGIKPNEWLTATTRAVSGQLKVIAAFNREHVHVDLVRPGFLKERSSKFVRMPLPEIKTVISRFEGASIFVNLIAEFMLDKNNLPGIVAATKFETKSGNLSLATKSVSLSVQGAPINEIRWSLRDGDMIMALEAWTECKISDTYLVEGFSLLSSTFDEFTSEAADDN